MEPTFAYKRLIFYNHYTINILNFNMQF
jgi:hypothetical protein